MASTQEREGTARFLGSYKVLSEIYGELQFYCTTFNLTQLLKKSNFQWNETEKRVSAVKVYYDVSVGVRYS